MTKYFKIITRVLWSPGFLLEIKKILKEDLISEYILALAFDTLEPSSDANV